MPWRCVLPADELWEGEMIGVRVAGHPVCLLNVEGELHAYEDRCAHLALPVSRGKLCGRLLVCAGHQWEYDACTGRGVNPDGIALRSYPVRVDGGNIQVDVDGG